MKKQDCLRWAKALINGKHEKFRGRMSNALHPDKTPTAMCCLGVANEEFKISRGNSRYFNAEMREIAFRRE